MLLLVRVLPFESNFPDSTFVAWARESTPSAALTGTSTYVSEAGI